MRAKSPYVGDDGKTKRHSVYGRTRLIVRDKLKTARDRLEGGAPVRDATVRHLVFEAPRTGAVRRYPTEQVAALRH
jgi:hypothetical protein